MKGSEVKKILKDTGYSLTRIAENMNISTGALNQLLNVEDIKTGVLEQIAKAAGKDIFFFLGIPDIVRIPKVNDEDPELAKMIQTIHAIVNYLEIFKK